MQRNPENRARRNAEQSHRQRANLLRELLAASGVWIGSLGGSQGSMRGSMGVASSAARVSSQKEAMWLSVSTVPGA